MHEDRSRHQPGRGRPGLRLRRTLSRAPLQRAAPRHQRQHGQGGQAPQALAGPRRRDRPRRGQGQLHGRLAPVRREGQRAHEGRGIARPGDHRRAPVGHPAGVGAAPRADQARQLLQQRQGAVLLGTDQLQAGAGDVRVHAEPAVRRPAAAARRAQDAHRPRLARALHQRRAPRARVDAGRADGLGTGQGVDPLHAAAGDAGGDRHRGPGPRARPLRRRRARAQGHRHVDGQRPPPRRVPRQERRHGRRRRPARVRPRAGPEPPRRDDHRGHRQDRRRHSRGRLPGDHRGPAARAADPLPERLPAGQPLRVRDPPAVAGVLQERQADRAPLARLAAGVHGHAREGDGLRAAVRVLEGDGRQEPDAASRPRAG